MHTSKIRDIRPTDSFQYKIGPNIGKTGYGQAVWFEDGVSGGSSSLSAKPPYKIGDEVVYEITGQDTRGQNKLKIKLADSPHVTSIGAPQAINTQAATLLPNVASPSPATTSSQGVRGECAGNVLKLACDIVLRSYKENVLPDNAPQFLVDVETVALGLARISYRLEHGTCAAHLAVLTAQASAKSYGFTTVKSATDVAPTTQEDVPY